MMAKIVILIKQESERMKNLFLFLILLLNFFTLIIACSSKFSTCVEYKYICDCIKSECNGDPNLWEINECDNKDSSSDSYMVATIVLGILLAITCCGFCISLCIVACCADILSPLLIRSK